MDRVLRLSNSDTLGVCNAGAYRHRDHSWILKTHKEQMSIDFTNCAHTHSYVSPGCELHICHGRQSFPARPVKCVPPVPVEFGAPASIWAIKRKRLLHSGDLSWPTKGEVGCVRSTTTRLPIVSGCRQASWGSFQSLDLCIRWHSLRRALNGSFNGSAIQMTCSQALKPTIAPRLASVHLGAHCSLA